MDMPVEDFIENIFPNIPNPYKIEIAIHGFFDDEMYIMSIERPSTAPPGSGFNYLADVLKECDKYRINAGLEITDLEGLDKLMEIYQELGFVADIENQDEDGIAMYREYSDTPFAFPYRKIENHVCKNKVAIGNP